MDFITDLWRSIDPVAMGLTLALLGATFWYMPRSGTWRAVEQNNLRNTENWRTHGQFEAANKVEVMYANARKRLPVYGISFIVAGGSLFIWGVLR